MLPLPRPSPSLTLANRRQLYNLTRCRPLVQDPWANLGLNSPGVWSRLQSAPTRTDNLPGNSGSVRLNEERSAAEQHPQDLMLGMSPDFCFSTPFPEHSFLCSGPLPACQSLRSLLPPVRRGSFLRLSRGVCALSVVLVRKPRAPPWQKVFPRSASLPHPQTVVWKADLKSLVAATGRTDWRSD